jgi:hypothetical protein
LSELGVSRLLWDDFALRRLCTRHGARAAPLRACSGHTVRPGRGRRAGHADRAVVKVLSSGGRPCATSRAAAMKCRDEDLLGVNALRATRGRCDAGDGWIGSSSSRPTSTTCRRARRRARPWWEGGALDVVVGNAHEEGTRWLGRSSWGRATPCLGRPALPPHVD